MPGSIVPSWSCIRSAIAPFFVAATIAWAGVIPSSTSPSTESMEPTPGCWFSVRGVRVNSGALAR